MHELWPGHFLDALHSKKLASPVLKSFSIYTRTEGWAHYAEEMMWEQGLGDGDAKVQIGMLLNALLRNVRYLCAIGLHARGMNVARATKLFQDKAFQPLVHAREQAVRGTFDPMYLSYTLGKLMIRKLARDYREKKGDDYSPQGLPRRVPRLLWLGADPGDPARDARRRRRSRALSRCSATRRSCGSGTPTPQGSSSSLASSI